MSTPPAAQKRAIALGLQVNFIPTGATESITEGYYLKSITKGPITIEQFDTTHLMTESDFREFMSLMKDPGDATVSAFFDPEKPLLDVPDHSDTLRESGADGILSISYRRGGQQIVFFTCAANVQEYGGFTAEAGTIMMSDWKFKLTGKPTGGVQIPLTGKPTGGVQIP